MSKPMKIISGLAGVLVLVAVALSMFGKLELPIGPLNGMLAGDDAVVAEGGDPNAFTPPVDDCLDGSTVPGTGTDLGADPNAPGATEPGAVDPNAPNPDPNAPVASGGDGWSRVLVADVGDGTGADPATGAPAADPNAPVDPAADPNVVDPAATTGPVDPCADVNGGTGATDPALGDPNAGGATDPAAAGGGEGADPAAQPKAKPVTSDGTNNGNSPEALTAAADASEVMKKAGIEVTTVASLVPTAGGVGKGAALRRYRNQVTGATLVIRLGDAALPQWTEAGKKVQRNLVSSFLTRLGGRYGKATRSVTVLDSGGNVLAIGDAAPKAKGSVKLY